jgi:hypothetical protein
MGRWSAAVVASLVLTAPAGAADGVIDGTPMNVYANDVGRLQAAFDGASSGEFYTGALAPTDGGFTAAVVSAQTPAADFSFFGRGGTPFTATGAPVVSGNGSPTSPWTLQTSFQAAFTGGPVLLTVNETVQYVNGTNDVTVTYAVQAGQGLANVRLFESASVLPAGSYFATGFINVGPPRRVGAQALGRGLGGSGSLVEVTPWSHFQEAAASAIDNVFAVHGQAAQGFNDTILPTATSNGAGVGAQWNIGALNPGVPATVTATWHFNRTNGLDLVAASPTQTAGQTARVTVSTRTNDGAPDVGRAIRYTITGANPGAGAVTTAADGTAVISWLGAKTGTDTLTAFADRDGNGSWDVNTEPRQIVTVTFAPLPPPVPGKSVNVNVVSGEVFVKLPGARRARATGPGKGFVPLTGQLQIPVGSQLDTRKGRVKLTSAADSGGKKTQASDFYDGVFQVRQAAPKKSKKPQALFTDIVLKGQLSRSSCARARAAAVDKKKGPKSVLGKLWGNGKGKFRTTGKYSSATVRGTIWLTQDECDGTLTKVKRGVVQVRDFKRKKTLTVKTGHSYLARAVSKSRH